MKTNYLVVTRLEEEPVTTKYIIHLSIPDKSVAISRSEKICIKEKENVYIYQLVSVFKPKIGFHREDADNA